MIPGLIWKRSCINLHVNYFFFSVDCVFISGFGIASFCGNIIGIVVGILFCLRYKYSHRSSSHDLQNTHEPTETDRYSLPIRFLLD